MCGMMFPQQESGWSRLRFGAVEFRSGEKKGGNEWRQAVLSAVRLWHCLATCQAQFATCQAGDWDGTGRGLRHEDSGLGGWVAGGTVWETDELVYSDLCQVRKKPLLGLERTHDFYTKHSSWCWGRLVTGEWKEMHNEAHSILPKCYCYTRL